MGTQIPDLHRHDSAIDAMRLGGIGLRDDDADHGWTARAVLFVAEDLAMSTPERSSARARDRWNVGPSGTADGTVPSLVAAVVASYARRHRLSTRETSVLQLTAGGVHRKETAARLRCGIATVDTYWRRILRKTGLASQVEVLAAVLCHAFGNPDPYGSSPARRPSRPPPPGDR